MKRSDEYNPYYPPSENPPTPSEPQSVAAADANQAEDIEHTRFRRTLHELGRLITGNSYAFLTVNPEIEESLKVYRESVSQEAGVKNTVASLDGGARQAFEQYMRDEWPDTSLAVEPESGVYLDARADEFSEVWEDATRNAFGKAAETVEKSGAGIANNLVGSGNVGGGIYRKDLLSQLNDLAARLRQMQGKPQGGTK